MNSHEVTVLEDDSKLSSRKMEIYKAGDLGSAPSVIQERFLRDIDSEKSVIDKLKSGEPLEGKDLLTTVSELENADFSVEEIITLLESVESGSLDSVLQEMASRERSYIEGRLNNPEFFVEFDIAKSKVLDMGLKTGVRDLLEQRWPRVVYTGKVGRMINRINSINQFSTHACAGGEYVHEDGAAYMYLTKSADIPAGKEILSTQIHESLHAVSPNNVSKGENSTVNESGFGVITNNEVNPLESTYFLLNLNEGFTEYFARMFTEDSFSGQKLEKHAYDVNVEAVRSLIFFIAENENVSVEEIEEQFFSLYINGDKDKFRELIINNLGKYSIVILDVLPENIQVFFKSFLEYKKTGFSGVGFEFLVDHLRQRGVSVSDFKKEYPFVKVMEEDLNYDTFETTRREVLND